MKRRLDLRGDVVAVFHSTRDQSRKPGGQPPMDTIGLDLHKRESQLCVLTPDGTATERRIVTSRERFTV